MSTNKLFNVVNLNNSWVITKRHNGNIFFKRTHIQTCVKNHPTKDCVYYDEAKVIEEVNKLNSTRKKCKYGYENASKYFVNKWYFNAWSGPTILNSALPIKSVNEKTELQSFKSCVSEMQEAIKNGIKRDQERAESYREELPKRIQRLVDDYESYIKNSLESVEKHKENLMLLESINLDDIMAEYETQGDKMVKILYGKKTETIQQTNNDEVPF